MSNVPFPQASPRTSPVDTRCNADPGSSFWSNLAQHAVLEGLERAQLAIVVVTVDARPVFANPAADAILRRGGALMLTHGRLTSSDVSVGARLATLIRNAASILVKDKGNLGAAIAIPRDDRLPLTLLIAPFRPAPGGSDVLQPAAIIFIRDPELPIAAKRALQELFGLTPAEATIAAALAAGKSIEDIAETAKIGLNTVRTQIKRIFLKTGTNRQAQLVTVILGSIATLTAK
jgi:DNA-binding CsgD family transcriptional regulator